ncbi:MAG: TMEM165/GDT1 family protein [Methanothrix sp.]|jgi:putative Ca2+/H+ antiporter (TMEM165/GDT1 family)|nr:MULTISPECIES: TMEM165/GDT1 family protein [Methanothrix]MBC7079775.1 TMEM165/GDT1 family protein [Methanothrix sp.]NPU87852.1 TMEM165/GDT1 family protein [Methanothrix sp.]
MFVDLFIPFITIAIAELGDKTQLSVLLLSTRTKEHFKLLIGVMSAFLIVDGFAILLGAWITEVVPASILKIISGGIFLLFGIITLRDLDGDEGDGRKFDESPFLSGFLVIFLAEWGDKTQIASAVFATQYNPWLVLGGTMLALFILSISAIYLGRFILGYINRRTITLAAGLIFMAMGIVLLLL